MNTQFKNSLQCHVLGKMRENDFSVSKYEYTKSKQKLFKPFLYDTNKNTRAKIILIAAVPTFQLVQQRSRRMIRDLTYLRDQINSFYLNKRSVKKCWDY